MSDMNMQADKTAEYNRLPRKMLYVAGLGASMTALLSVRFIQPDAAPSSVTIWLLALGFCASWAVRSGWIPKTAIYVTAITLLGIGGILVRYNQDFAFKFVPVVALDETGFMAIALFVWFIVICSFRLTTDVSVLFLCVPGLSLMGLLASYEPTIDMIACFSIFLGFVCFLLMQHSILTWPKKLDSARRVRINPGSMKVQIGVTASVTLIAISLGSIGTVFYPMIFGKMPLRPPLSIAPTDFRLDEDYVPVGDGSGPTSLEVIMTVQSDKPVMLKESSYDRYTGNTWRTGPTASERRTISPVGTPDGKTAYMIPEADELGERSSVEQVEQTIQIMTEGLRRVYCAADPEVITFDRKLFLPLHHTSGLIFSVTHERYTSYTVISQVSTANPFHLASASEDYPPAIREKYLLLPERSRPVKDLVDEITRDRLNAYEKAVAIQDYLLSTCTYDRSSTPSGEDSVLHFLFTSQKGYCDMFATAMVIMARAAGIPARWVVGYAPTEYDEYEDIAIVRAKDRHAWAELYFPGYGWITFDPTPGAADSPIKSRLFYAWQVLSEDRNALLGAVLIILLTAYLLKVEVVDRFRRKGRRGEIGSLNEVTAHYLKMCRLLMRFGYPRDPASTPLEYAKLIRDLFEPNLRNLSSAVDSVTSDFVECRYGGRELSCDRVNEMADLLGDMARQLKSARRQRQLPQRI